MRRDDAGAWWARREVKPGKQAPPGWVLAEHDEVTGTSIRRPAHPGSRSSSPRSRRCSPSLVDIPAIPGTDELCGPKINGNPEWEDAHGLVPHGAAEVDPGRTYDELAAWLATHEDEGVVRHHPDGRTAKLKRRDLPP